VGVTRTTGSRAQEREVEVNVPVNLLSFLPGEHYSGGLLAATRSGFATCASPGNGELRVGRHNQVFQATELADAEKLEVLRAYLKRWKAEVGVFFAGVGADASDADLLASRPNHPGVSPRVHRRRVNRT